MGGLAYGIQEEYKNFIGNADSPVTLTNDFAGNTETVSIAGASEVSLYVAYTPGENAGTFELKVETSPDKRDDAVTFFQDVTASVVSGTITATQSIYEFVGATAAQEYLFRILVPVADRTLKVSIRENGVAVAGTAYVRCLYSGRT